MKTTTMFRNIANPRRTTLAHLKDAEDLQAAPATPEHSVELPTQTANPRRTILMDAPAVTPAQ
uniref:FXSXX-COOH protein n=1 Tax=Streptomyces sp. NBC_00049 TaxID=2903617 RepID=A0AAU2JWF3_9ACTN